MVVEGKTTEEHVEETTLVVIPEKKGVDAGPGIEKPVGVAKKQPAKNEQESVAVEDLVVMVETLSLSDNAVATKKSSRLAAKKGTKRVRSA